MTNKNPVDNTKAIVSSLNFLTEKDFVITSVDFSTGVVVCVIPNMSPVAPPAPAERDPAAVHHHYKLTSNEMSMVIRGDLVSTIKAVRERTGAALLAAKELTEKFQADVQAKTLVDWND